MAYTFQVYNLSGELNARELEHAFLEQKDWRYPSLKEMKGVDFQRLKEVFPSVGEARKFIASNHLAQSQRVFAVRALDMAVDPESKVVQNALEDWRLKAYMRTRLEKMYMGKGERLSLEKMFELQEVRDEEQRALEHYESVISDLDTPRKAVEVWVLGGWVESTIKS